MMFSILNVIKQYEDRYTPTEAKIAAYILVDTKNVIKMSTQELAQKSETSPAAIIRFCKTLGIQSFKDLKIELAQAISIFEDNEEQDLALQFKDNTEAVIEKVFSQSQKALENTKRILQVNTVEQAAEAMKNAKRIYFYGASESSLVAKDAYYKFLRTNHLVFYSEDSHIAMTMGANFNSEDVLFVVSKGGKTKEVLELLELARKKGVKTVVLTEHHASPALKLADFPLCTSCEEHNLRIGTMTTRIVQLAVIDALFIQVCNLEGEIVYDRVIETYNVVTASKKR
ncbi:MAG: MurR/RpiR family transcriptional regulator [Bacillaceae bacterium]